jgi:hypothetical protein
MSQDYSKPAPVTPGVVMWFKIYAGFLGSIYVLCSLMSLVFFFPHQSDVDLPESVSYAMGLGVLLLCWGLAFLFFFPIFKAPRPWLYTYDLVLICIGLTSPCFLPICIPLLIFWLKPETKNYFGK